MESAKLFLFFSFPLSIRSWSCHSRWWGTGYENASKPLVIMQAKDASKTKKKIRALERELLNQDRAKRKAEGFATQSWKMRSEQKKRLERKKITTFTQKQEYLLHLVTQWYDKKKKAKFHLDLCDFSPGEAARLMKLFQLRGGEALKLREAVCQAMLQYWFDRNSNSGWSRHLCALTRGSTAM